MAAKEIKQRTGNERTGDRRTGEQVNERTSP